MNPYAKNLDGREPLGVLAATPAALSSIDPSRYSQPWSPGKWTYGQILAHMADCEMAFGFRLRQAIAEDDYTSQSFDQDKWADSYPSADAGQALAAFVALRAYNLAFLRGLPPEAFDKPLTHPEWGPLTFRTVVEIIAGHDLNHLAQL